MKVLHEQPCNVFVLWSHADAGLWLCGYLLIASLCSSFRILLPWSLWVQMIIPENLSDLEMCWLAVSVLHEQGRAWESEITAHAQGICYWMRVFLSLSVFRLQPLSPNFQSSNKKSLVNSLIFEDFWNEEIINAVTRICPRVPTSRNQTMREF